MTGWTDERVERAKTMRANGASASEIAKALGGVTRNAVIAKLHRAGCTTARPASKPGAVKVRPPRVPKQPKRASPANPVIICGNGATFTVADQRAPHETISARAWRPLSGSTPRPWVDRGRGCHWPVDVAGAEIQHSCCAPKPDDDPLYCVPHRAMARSASQPAASPKARANELIRSTRRYAA